MHVRHHILLSGHTYQQCFVFALYRKYSRKHEQEQPRKFSHSQAAIFWERLVKGVVMISAEYPCPGQFFPSPGIPEEEQHLSFNVIAAAYESVFLVNFTLHNLFSPQCSQRTYSNVSRPGRYCAPNFFTKYGFISPPHTKHFMNFHLL